MDCALAKLNPKIKTLLKKRSAKIELWKNGIAKVKHVINPSTVIGYDNNQTPKLVIAKKVKLPAMTETKYIEYRCDLLSLRFKNFLL